jgi:glycerol-3-phosphate dehydrogenase
MCQSRLFAGLFILVCLIQTAGCGGKEDPALVREKVEFQEIYRVYQHFIKSQEKPPAEMSEIATTQYEMLYPATLKSLQDGKFVVVWNVNTKDARTVLAYDKDAAEKGGAVLMANGTVKTMTAREFAAVKPAS